MPQKIKRNTNEQTNKNRNAKQRNHETDANEKNVLGKQNFLMNGARKRTTTEKNLPN